jgi:hypothetical protein
MTDLSVNPFWDDYQTVAKDKNYHRILFVPGNAVQARELTQIQSILQEQIKRMGDSLFQNGTVVAPGHIFYDNRVVSLKIADSYASVTIDSIGPSLVGYDLVGSSGVVAQVIHFTAATQTEQATLFVKYKSSNGATQAFFNGEVLYSPDLTSSVQISSAQGSVGVGSLATISEGIYYINGLFVGVAKQTLVLEKYSSTPSYVVGLQFNETVVTASEDGTLYDNALGFPNYAAPGAARYQINLTLEKKNLDFSDLAGQALITFIPLLKVDTGVIQFMLNETKYSEIEKMLARRTFDASGDYIVNDFKITTRAYRSNNRGTWVTGTPFITGDIITNGGVYYMAKNNGYSGNTAPSQLYGESSDGGIYWLQTTTPAYNNGVNQSTSATLQDHIADEQKVSIQVSPGKAYVTGFEVTIQEKTTIIGNKARTVEQKDNIQIYTPSGSYALVNTVTGIVDTGTMTQVNLKTPAGSTVGTAWATALEFVSGTPGAASAVYKLYLFNMKLNSGYDFATDILTVESVTASLFSGTFVQDTVALSGTVSTTTSSAVVTGKGTLFTQELKVSDQVQINGVSKVVLSIESDTSLTLSTTYASTLVDVAGYALIVKMKEVGSYIQPLPNVYMRNMKTAAGLSDTIYTVLKTLTLHTTGTSGALTLSTTGETFDGIVGHIVVDTATHGIINASYALDSTATILTISGLTTNHDYKIIAKVKRSGTAAREKTKTLTTKTIIATSTGITDDLGNAISSAWNMKSNVISLAKCDVQRIIKVTMSGADGAYNATGESDVTPWFTLNSNVYITHYDISTATRSPSIIPPSRALKITYEYFEHSTGDYFSVDSYASVPYEKIPVETHGGLVYVLRDSLDFRSRISDDGVNFTNTGGNVSTPIYTSSTISTSYSYYLPRKDIISVNSSGKFEYTEGISALNAVAPTVGDGSMQLAELSLEPYTMNAAVNVAVIPAKHRRYTMQDISKLDDRLANVEYYVSLNELEKSTSQMQIYDANGLTRYKNGFIADPFNSLDVADIQSNDFKAIIDINKQELRPMAKMERVPLVEPTGTTPSSRLADGYQITGDWITLPYTEVSLVSQLTATRTEFVNPFAVFSWNGFCKLSPEKDNWTDTTVNTQSVTYNGFTYTKNIYNYTWWWSWNDWGWW